MSVSIGQPQENPIVEKIAQRKFKYEKIFEEQAMELRKDPIRCERVYERVSQLMSTKPDQEWMPKAAEKEAYMERMDRICNKEPTSFDE
jgi:hypothetical protein